MSEAFLANQLILFSGLFLLLSLQFSYYPSPSSLFDFVFLAFGDEGLSIYFSKLKHFS